MSCHEQAHLAYGYPLFVFDEWKIAEAEVWRHFPPPWLDENDIHRSVHRKLLLADGMDPEGYEAQRFHEDRLLMGRKSLGLDLFGNFERSGSGYFLHAGPVQVAYAYAPRPVLSSVPHNADENLAWAVSVLEITPLQPEPQWMIYPSYK